MNYISGKSREIDNRSIYKTVNSLIDVECISEEASSQGSANEQNKLAYCIDWLHRNESERNDSMATDATFRNSPIVRAKSLERTKDLLKDHLQDVDNLKRRYRSKSLDDKIAQRVHRSSSGTDTDKSRGQKLTTQDRCRNRSLNTHREPISPSGKGFRDFIGNDIVKPMNSSRKRSKLAMSDRYRSRSLNDGAEIKHRIHRSSSANSVNSNWSLG